MASVSDLNGKTAVVTGATTGLGRSIARVWAAQGANVVAVGRREELGRALEAEATEQGHKLTFVRGDVSISADCDKTVAKAVELHGTVDILVNNAGIEGPISDIHNYTDEQWDEVFDVNVGGTFRMCRAVIPVMKEHGGGAILNVASINAVNTLAHMAPYNASKAAVVQFSRTIAIEYIFDGIRCNSILLGGVRGGETAERTQDELAKYMRGPGYVRPHTDAEDPLGQVVLQAPDDVAQLLAPICSDAMRLMTGATIAVDRGMTAGLTGSMMTHLSTANLLQIGQPG